jgi:hypothetical protein
MVKHKPNYEGYFLGNFLYLERNHPEFDRDGVRATAARYREVRAVAAGVHARTIVAFVPAPVSVCDARALRYYPRFVDLADASRYDPELPEHRIRAIAAASGVILWDLEPELRALAPCPYMPKNMHFTIQGQRDVAALLARRIEGLR